MAEKPMSVEIASAYVSLSADTRQIPKDVRKALGQAEGTAESSGQSIGRKLSSGLGKAMKVGGLAAGATAAAAIGKSLTNGFQRLDAIEQAQTKFEALGYTAKQQAGLMDDVTDSVKGTAFATSDAADAAAMALAGGIKPGKELTGVLKTVGDSASFANKGFGEVAPIFTQAINRGKVMGDTLARLEDNAIPATQALANSMGKTAEEIQDMASKGEISFEDLQKAMDGTIGGQALKAGDTFQGSLANVGAAMGRLGETILEGPFNAAPGVFSKVSDGIDVLNEKLGGTIELFSTGEFSEDIGEKLGVGKDAAVVDRILSARDAVDKMRGAVELFFTGDFNSSIRERLGVEEDSKLVDDILNIRDVFADWGERVADVFRELGELGKQLYPSFESIAVSLGKATAKVSAATWEALLRVVEALVPVLEKVLVPVFETLADVMEDNPKLVEGVLFAFMGFKGLKFVNGVFGGIGKSAGLLSKGFTGLKGAMGIKAGATAGGIIASSLGAVGRAAKGAFPNIAQAGSKAAGAAKGFVQFLKPVGKGAGALGKFSKPLGGVVGKLGAKGLLGIVGKVALKFVPFIGWIWTAYEALKWFFTKTETGQKVFEGLKNILSNVWGWIRDTFVAGFEWAGDVLGGIWDGVTGAWDTVWSGITGFLSTAWEGMKTAWDTVGQPVVDFIKGAWDVLWTALEYGFYFIVGLGAIAWQGIKATWDTIGQPVVDFIKQAFEFLWNGIEAVLGWIRSGWDLLWQGLQVAYNAYVVPVIDWIKGAFESMKNALIIAWDWVKQKWSDLWQGVQNIYHTHVAPVVDWVVTKFNEMRDKVVGAWEWVKTKIQEFASWIGGKMTEIGNTIMGLYDHYVAPWADKIRGGIDRVVGFFSGLKDRIIGAVSDAKDWLVQSGKWVIEGLINGMKKMIGKAVDTITNIGGNIIDAGKRIFDEHSPSRVFHQIGVFVGEGLANGIDSMGKTVEKSAVDMANRVAGVEMPSLSVSAQLNDQGLNVEASAQSVSATVTEANPAPSSRYEGGAPPAVQQVDQGTESFEASSEAVNASVQGTFTPAVQQADLSMTGFGANVQATATGVVTPQWQGMANNVAGAANGVIAPAFGAVQAGLSHTGARFVQQTAGVMTPMWNAMGANVQRVRQAVTDPAMAGIRSALSATGTHFTNSVNGTINPVWSAMGNHVKAVKDGTVLPVFNAVQNGLTTLSGWFGTSVNNIGTAWDRLRAATARPAKFVVETVMNNGIRNAWNAVADLIGEKKMQPVGLGALGGYATGGVLPGYTPGKDVHHFSSPTGGRISLSGGEAIMRPEWTRAVGGPRAVAEMNSAARSGKMSRLAKEEAKANRYHQAFAEGGIVQAMTRIVQRKYPMLTMTSGQVGRTGGLHGAGMAADFSNGSGNTPQQLALARDIAKTYPNSAELIYDSPGWSGNIKNGQNVGAFGQFYTMAQAGPHHHHVHWGMNTAPTMPFGGGVFPGGSSGGAVAMVSMADMVKDAWNAEIKKIRDYSEPGLFGAMPNKFKKSASEKAWGYLKKQADKMDADAGPGSWNPGAGVEQYRPGIVKAFRFQQEDPKKNRVDALLRQIWTESKGDPNIAQQIVDMNGTGESAGVGLYQVIPSTWAGFRDPRLPDNRRNVWAAHNFAVRYFRDRHNWNTGPGGVGLPNTGWKSGGVLPANLPAALFDNGGYLQDGQVGQNQSGKPEPVFTHKQWQILKGNIMSAAQAGDLKKLQINLGIVANGLQQAVAKLDWQEIFGAASKAFNEKFFDDQAADVRSVFGIPDPDSIPAVKAYAEFRENEKKLNEEQAQAAKDSREAATRADSAADKISGAPVPVKAKSESVSVGSQVARTGALVSRALANPNPATFAAAANSAGQVINNINVVDDNRAYAEFRKMEAKRTRGRVGAR